MRKGSNKYFNYLYIRMPMNFDLEQVRKEHNCVNYFETGLWDPRCDVSINFALASGFDKLFSIEIRQDWVDLGKEKFKTEIEQGKFHLILDDSTNMNKYLNNIAFVNKTLFFLDAHVDNTNIHNFKKRCPVLDELEAIKAIERKDNIILIDDLRYLKEPFPWGEDSYGNINFLQKIKEIILTINVNYKFSTLNGQIEDDVLLAYV